MVNQYRLEDLPELSILKQILQSSGEPDFKPPDAASVWRIQRAKKFTELALATLNQTKTTSAICFEWSEFAISCLKWAYQETNQEIECEYPPSLFCYGKLGSLELNLSSDVDLLLISKEADPKHKLWVRRFIELLQQKTAFGFCFRVDLDLRPGGSQGPPVISIEQFLDYFLYLGEPWQRLAFIRLRAITGDPDLILDVESAVQKFCFPKRLDHRLIDNLGHIRQRIYSEHIAQAHYSEESIHLKLGLGGIRDIELWLHSHQVIFGHRDPRLKDPRTDSAIKALVDCGLIDKKIGDKVLKHYWILRHFENVLQGTTDRQLYWIQPTQPPVGILTKDFSSLRRVMKFNQKVVDQWMGPIEESSKTMPHSFEEQTEWLKEIGFSSSTIDTVWTKISQRPEAFAQNAEAEKNRKQSLYQMIESFKGRKVNLDRALTQFADFLSASKYKSSLFYVLAKNQKLLEASSKLFCYSPQYAEVLSRRPEILDQVFLSRGKKLPVPKSMTVEAALEQASLLKLSTEIQVALQFLDSCDLSNTLDTLSALADQVVKLLWTALDDPQLLGSQISVLALGKWGAHELGLGSDLDFIFVTPDSPTPAEVKAARKLTGLITSGSASYRLYSIDLRLLPQERSGTILTTIPNLVTYLKEKSAGWERLVYLLSREVPLHPEHTSLEKLTSYDQDLKKTCAEKSLSSEELQELNEIRKKLLVADQEDQINLKYNEGGLLDIELHTQALYLKLCPAEPFRSNNETLALLAKNFPELGVLRENYLALRKIEQLLFLWTGQIKQNLRSQGHEFIDDFFEQIFISHSDQKQRAISEAPASLCFKKTKEILLHNRAILKKVDPWSNPL